MKNIEQEFLNSYPKYWTEDESLYGVAAGDYCRMLDQKAARLEKKEISCEEVIEESGKDRRCVTEHESETVTGEKKITKIFRRHGRTLYKKTQTRQTNLTVQDGEVAGFYYSETFTGSWKRYLYIANQIAAFPVVFLYLMLPQSQPNTMPNRLKDILFCVAVVLPVMWLLAWIACGVRSLWNDAREKKACAAREATEEAIRKNWPQIDVKEMKNAMDTQLRMIHFAADKGVFKTFGCEEADRLLLRYENICDCSVGAVRFGMAEIGKRRITLPAKARIYLLKDNGRNLVPSKEVVNFTMEYTTQWKIVEYEGNVKYRKNQ